MEYLVLVEGDEEHVRRIRANSAEAAIKTLGQDAEMTRGRRFRFVYATEAERLAGSHQASRS